MGYPNFRNPYVKNVCCSVYAKKTLLNIDFLINITGQAVLKIATLSFFSKPSRLFNWLTQYHHM